MIALDIKATYAGNRRYIPIDVDASRNAGSTVRIEENAYGSRYPDYFRMDIKATYRRQSKKITQEWIIDIQNVKKERLYINSRWVLKMIQENIKGWESMVPKYVEEQIKENRLFGYQPE